MDELEDLLNFLIEVDSLKKTIRYSSCPEYVQEPVAGHVWKVSLMAPILARIFNLQLDIQHTMEIANIHDLQEYTGREDFDSYFVHIGKLSQEDKKRKERETIESLRDNFDIGPKVYSLWQEYEERKTPEAKYVRALDKLESLIHIIACGGSGRDPNDISYLATYADNAVKNFTELEPFLRIVKKYLKPVAERQGAIWKKEYDYPY
jgi:putative hydrolase of HD superfamily